MSSTRSRNALILKILEKLGVAATGQPPEIEDTQRVDDNLDSLIAEMSAREIVDIGDLDAIEPEFFLSVASICAYELRDEFGVTGETLVDLMKKNDEAIAKLQVMTRVKPTYEPAKPSYF
jgi:hypothetical protein